MDRELPEDNSSSSKVSTLSGSKAPFPLSREIGCTSRLLSCASLLLFSSGLAASHSHVISARPDLATLSSVVLVPLAFSLCFDANGRIGLLAIGSLECSSLCLPRVN